MTTVIEVSANQYMATTQTEKEYNELVFNYIWNYVSTGKMSTYSIWGGSQMCPLTQTLRGWIDQYWKAEMFLHNSSLKEARIANPKKKVIEKCLEFTSKNQLIVY